MLAMHRNPKLTSLDLAHTQVMASGAQALSLLGFNHSITSLNLRGSRLGVNGGVLIAEKLLAHSGGCALSYLNLRGNDIRGVGAVAVARALVSHQNNVVFLDLSHNRVDGSGFAALGNLLAEPADRCNLTNLNLKGNNAQAGGALALSKGLAKNETLVALNLQACGIVTEGGLQILEACAEQAVNIREKRYRTRSSPPTCQFSLELKLKLNYTVAPPVVQIQK